MERTHKEFIPVMLTPFQDNGSVDYEGLSRLVEFYLESGVSGLFANCQSSEMYALQDDERMSILKHVLKVVDGAVPVVATGAFGGPVEEQADSIRRMYDTGIRAAIVITCLIAGKEEPDEVFNERVFRLLDLSEAVPLGFYECPEPYKRVLSAEQLGRFVKTGRVIYHKDTCLDIGLVREKLAATEGHDFGFYDAYMVHAVESLKAGAKGLSCIQGNFFPELIVWLCENYDRPASRAEVEKLQQFLAANMDVMHTAYPNIAKYFLCRRGILKSTFSRLNAGAFDDTVKENIDKLFIAYQGLRKDLEVF
ncbi:MAG TPA: dihydrodipicolinate synthase family protein [Anseongella sp.]|nr:dihydrodipicolinate synthase family protein [Anseongella sp.]